MKYQLEFADGVDRQIAKFKRSKCRCIPEICEYT